MSQPCRLDCVFKCLMGSEGVCD